MTDQPTTHDEFYDKLHGYLLDHNQQELAGHLDALWQELGRLRTRENSELKQIEAEATTDDDTGAGGWGFKKN